MSETVSLIVVCIFSCMLGVTASAQEGDIKKVTSVEGVTEYQLDNGARVVLFPENSEATVTVNMTVLVGSRHEGYGEAGMAHLLEHMVFKGTPAFPDVPGALRAHGASFNGTTNRDRTNYFETLPANDKNLEFAIHLEASRLVDSYVKHEDLMSEFSVVRNEFERGENSPQRVLGERVRAAAYEWHNYGKSTIGNRSDIERVPIDNLREFYRKYYQPDNVVMVITGRFETKKALALVQKHLGAIPKPKRELPKTYTEEPAQDGERVVTLNRVGEVPSLSAVYHMPSASHKDWAPLSILGSIISEDKVGLLEQVLVESKLATSASGRADSAHDPGLFSFSLSPSDGKFEESKKVFIETIDTLGKQKFSQAAIDRAKKQYELRSERLMNSASRMSQALSGAASLGDWRLLFLQRDRIQAVTLEDVQRVAATYFPPHNRTIGMFLPTAEPKRMEIPIVPSIAALVKDYKGGVAIASGEAFDPNPETLDERIQNLNANGLKVALLRKKNRGETVNMTISLKYGNEESLKGKTTAAGMVSGMLMAGTKTMDRQALRARMAELGVVIGGGGGGGRRGRRGRGGGGRGGAGSLTFSITAKRSSLVPAIELLGEILREPAFPEEVFEQSKMRSSMGMKRMSTDPGMKARMELSRALSPYDKDDIRYVPTIEETIERIENVTLDDVKDVYAKQIGAATGEVAIVGDFDPIPVMEALSKIQADWNTDVEYRQIVREVKSDLKGMKKTINTPDMANAQFSASLSFPMNDQDEDYEALVLGNYILGGSTLSSRIGNRIRGKEGLSYGATSSIAIPTKGNDARFSISASLNPENMDAVEKAAAEELAKYLADGPTAEEVASAKQGWLDSRKVSRSSDRAIAGQVISNLNLERDFAFTAKREKKVADLTPEQIHAAFKKHIDPSKLMIIRAGDLGEE